MEGKDIIAIITVICVIITAIFSTINLYLSFRSKRNAAYIHITNNELKVKFIKLKLHFIYCGIIFLIISVLLFTTRNYSNQDLSQQLSLAATLIGIVLSVIAIFMSIMGEKDISSTKDKLVLVSDDLIKITEGLNDSIGVLKEVALIKDDMRMLKEQNEFFSGKFDSFYDMFQNDSAKDDSYKDDIDYKKILSSGMFQDKFRSVIISIVYYYIKKREDQNYQGAKTKNFLKEVYDNLFGEGYNMEMAYTYIGSSYLFMLVTKNNEDFRQYIVDEFINDQSKWKEKVEKYFS